MHEPIPPDETEVKVMDTAEVVTEVKHCIPFIRGVTVSGGECMLQTGFIEELFSCLKPLGLTCLIDSNGTIPFAQNNRLLDLCDGVMLDVKAWDKSVYHSLTGAKDNNIVKDNLALLLKYDKLTEVRIVCLPHGASIQTDTETILHHLAAIPEFISKQIPVRLLRFRPHGVVGELQSAPVPSEEQMQLYCNTATRLGLRFTVK